MLWSLIAAAFIGPGTVTTAARAGSEGGWHYLGFVGLAAAAGYLLMEMAARITLVSGQTLGQILGQRGKSLSWLAFLAVFLGCVAYQAGNLLGALGGIQLMWAVPRYGVLVFGGLAFLALWPGDARWISRALAGVVALMGILFVVVAISLIFGPEPLRGAGKVETNTIIALVGTTIVPYNFFLAAGLSHGQRIGEMRSGLLGSFVVGAVITLSIVLVGSVAVSFTSFADLAQVLAGGDADGNGVGIGNWGEIVLGIGLLAAGFSSAVTAPLAAALAGQQLLGVSEAEGKRALRSVRFRLIWGTVLIVGILVASLDLDIISVILAAQVANGLLLPLLAAIVLVFANDRQLLGTEVNALWQNTAGTLVAAYLAYKNFALLLTKVRPEPESGYWPEILTLIYLLGVSWLMYRRRMQPKTG